MTENMATVGQRVRELRLQRGMTQKALAGEQMTRNMLSLIENGLASPSIANIRYIADTLSVPIGYFFAESSEEEGKYWKMTVIGELRDNLAAKRYRDCVAALQAMPGSAVDDEVSLLGAQVYFRLAMHSAAGYEMRSAQGYLRTASDYLQKTQYAGEELRHAVQYYRDLLQVLSTLGEVPERLCDLHSAGVYVPLDMLLYFQSLRALSRPSGNAAQKDSLWREILRDEWYVRHLRAITAEEVDLHALRSLLNAPELPFSMRARVYSDAEDAANRAGDFKMAYTAARKKLELLELAKK